MQVRPPLHLVWPLTTQQGSPESPQGVQRSEDSA
jgi:hypothetical protein